MVAVIREVVVLPLLPVITIFLALLAPITDLSTLGSIRRATMPGKLVPPLTRSQRPVPPTSFPAEIASVKRALPRPDGGVNLPLLCCISSFTIKYLYLFVIVVAACSITKCQGGDKPDCRWVAIMSCANQGGDKPGRRWVAIMSCADQGGDKPGPYPA